MCNSHPFIDDYFHLIESGELPACEEQHLLIDYVKKILERDDVYIDAEMVENSIEIPAKYFPYSLYPWQKFVNVFIFGLRWKSDNTLVFNRYFIYMGRGGGKNGYLSYNSFFMLSKQHGIPNYDIDIVATSEDQAKRSFLDVYNVLEDEKNLKRLKKAFYRSKVEIRNNSTKSSMQYNTSNARTKDGKRPGCVIFDEEHEYDNYDTIKVFTSGGGKVQDYREFHISTDGNVRGGPLDDLKDEAKMILNGEIGIDESSLLPFICKLDKPEEVEDINNWAKANPSLPYNEVLLRKMKSEYSQMQRNAAIRIEFMTKRMNSPVEDTRKAVATYEDILATEQPVPDFSGFECIGAVDFAQIRDFCSVGALFKHEGKRYFKQHTFMHHTAPKLQDINKDIIQLAIKKGLLTVVHEASIDRKHVVNWFVEQAQKYHFLKVAMDLYRSTILKDAFEEAGFEVEIVRRGPATHGMLAPLVEEMFVKKEIVFGDDPLMRWYVNNVYKEERANGNVEYLKIDKEKRKTDGFFALLHSLVLDDQLFESEPFDPFMFNVTTF
ncbi:terminase TerL endonuclease subunit [Cytobacillus oceanisediminis]|uniref:terminase TerL endonuclease subunit n=1 Tax=Cytobacillus oceanisediminis TaxID=665099 RepID=UPI001FB3D0F3|nr:terminase TerL endonuclease subunit [Cytobacillus oceanisediminis]UOE57960.1 terminase large subunit [Cytobacillus oceanisediminis]